MGHAARVSWRDHSRGPTKTTPGVSSLIAASPVKTDLGNMGAGHKLGALTNGEVKKGMIKTAFFFWGLEFGWTGHGKDQRLTSATPLPPCDKHHVRSLHCHHFQEIQEDWGRCSSPALITCLENPAIITAPKINHWTMGVTGVIQPMRLSIVVPYHPISSHIYRWAHISLGFTPI